MICLPSQGIFKTLATIGFHINESVNKHHDAKQFWVMRKVDIIMHIIARSYHTIINTEPEFYHGQTY